MSSSRLLTVLGGVSLPLRQFRRGIFFDYRIECAQIFRQ